MAAKVNEASQQKGPAADKRTLILDSAFDLFRHYGYRRTSMEDIAQAANVAKGTLYLYFKSKDELFEALARQLGERIEANLKAAAARDTSAEDKIFALLDAKLGFIYRWVLSSPHAAEFIDSKHKLSGDVFEPVDRSFRAALTKTLKEGVRRGEFDPKAAGFSLDAAVDTLVAAAHGAEWGARDEADFRDRLERIVRLALRGLRPLPREQK
ncbi:MAG TPA: TetR/AcrR family transcriptional regulator [Parvibaculum sp.]|uniref:TetR/AcrR family transcriptional regulator n=1 Tax=Parvibaculum sp. TaxID=2024848 RepID=UPI002CF1F097|nr:TetR/AcrR family transcriptional regulator [Parvibaculum sp.]HMM13322.1 TetR/AcrR family transcriptional regulator [Parvibaculum sp.]